MADKPVISNRRKKGLIRSLTRFIVFCSISGTIIASAGIGSIYFKYSQDLPPLPDMVVVPPSEVSTIRSSDGQIMARYSDTWRVPLAYEDIPRTLLLAFLATEDARFFSHPGIDFKGILRAAIRNFQAGGVVEGGSTITQQLAKSLLTREKTFDRKIKEALLSLQIEAKYSKEDILLLYLNRIYLGNSAYGIQAASHHYFHRPVWELTLGEMALLGGLPQAPSRLDPTRNMDAALTRRKIVLERMVSKGFISREQANDAADEPLFVHRRKQYRSTVAPFCAEQVRQEMAKRHGKDWYKKGLEVISTCDVQMSQQARRSLSEGLEALDKRQGWRGPLERAVAEAEHNALLELGQTDRQLDTNDVLVGVVSAVHQSEATVKLAYEQLGRISLDEHKWAGTYTEFPIITTSDNRKVVNRNGRVSLDPKLKSLEEALQPGDAILVRIASQEPDGMFRLTLEQIPRVEGAFVGADRVTGHVKALIGSYDYAKNQVNRVHSVRQTGSLMKPLIYAKAYAMGLPPSTLISGAPFKEGEYNPTGKKATLDSTAWDGLTKSNNAISLRIHKYVLGEGSLKEYQQWGQTLGLGTPFQGYTSEILGTEQSLWDMTNAYLTIALGGERRSLQLIKSVHNNQGEAEEEYLHPLDEDNSSLQALRALLGSRSSTNADKLEPEALYITAANMREVTRSGTAKKAGRTLNFPTAGKTGTLPYDVWFIGWSPDFISGVWVGADRRNRVLGRSEKRNKVHGGNTALPIWLDWMKSVHGSEVSNQLLPTPPSSLEFPKIDSETGLLARSDGFSIPHLRGTVPTEIIPAPVAEVEMLPPPAEPTRASLPGAEEQAQEAVPSDIDQVVPPVVSPTEPSPKPSENSGLEPEESLPTLNEILD